MQTKSEEAVNASAIRHTPTSSWPAMPSKSIARRSATILSLKEKDLEDLRKGLLVSAVKFHQQIVEQQSDDPAVRADLGRADYDLAISRRSRAT